MDCTIEYGFGSNIKREETLPAADAFRLAMSPEMYGYAFINIYYRDRLVYTTQGLAGRRFICEDCPYIDDLVKRGKYVRY